VVFECGRNRPVSSPESQYVRNFKQLASNESGPVRLVMGGTRESCAPFVHLTR
jgi:hypothetical protein